MSLRLQRLMRSLFAEAGRLQERAELLAAGGKAHAAEAARTAAAACRAEADAKALFHSIGHMKELERDLVAARREGEREIERLQKDMDREAARLARAMESERAELHALVREAERRAEAMALALRDADGGFALDDLVREAAQRVPAKKADGETIAVFGVLLECADPDGIVAISLADLRRATRLAEPRIRRSLVRLAAADAIETAPAAFRHRARGRPCFRVRRQTETRRSA